MYLTQRSGIVVENGRRIVEPVAQVDGGSSPQRLLFNAFGARLSRAAGEGGRRVGEGCGRARLRGLRVPPTVEGLSLRSLASSLDSAPRRPSARRRAADCASVCLPSASSSAGPHPVKCLQGRHGLGSSSGDLRCPCCLAASHSSEQPQKDWGAEDVGRPPLDRICVDHSWCSGTKVADIRMKGVDQ
jgi:hypothetical protein